MTSNVGVHKFSKTVLATYKSGAQNVDIHTEYPQFCIDL